MSSSTESATNPAGNDVLKNPEHTARTAESRPFQVFVKPAGPLCNLNCHYCYYLEVEQLYPGGESFRMSGEILELYIRQHIAASADPVIPFSWHGGEPTVLGLEYFRTIVALQRRHLSEGKRIANGIQTNGTLLDPDWCRFFAEEDFYVGVSLDGPQHLHDLHRVSKEGKSTFDRTLRGYRLLQQHGVTTEILCVVNADNVRFPSELYQFFVQTGARYITFLPLVEPQPEGANRVSSRTVPADAFGEFLCAVFDQWLERDIGRVKIQIFEEAARTAFGQEHSLCIFRETCGGVPVLEHNGDFYSCDHFVDPDHLLGNIRHTPLIELLESPEQTAFGRAKLQTLPRFCRDCEVRAMCNGGCPRNRFIETPDGEPGLNYLCPGYKRFFNHCRPFVRQVAGLWRWQNAGTAGERSDSAAGRPARRIGRNDPCPCGSGLKFKNCCMDR